VIAAGVAWAAVLGAAEQVFTAPSWVLFADLLEAWVCCPTRRTITGMLTLIDPAERGAHDAYHRLIRAGAWSMAATWAGLAALAVARFAPTGPITLQVDDTLFHKTGRKVDGAGSFRDAVASTHARIVYAHGLNLVVITLRVHAPWGGEPLGLPVNLRLFRKGGPTHAQLVQAMIAELAGWLPQRSFILCGDGAYATLAGAGLPRTHVISRIRRDAALFEPAPPRTGRRGRPAKKGARLPTPAAQATAADPKHWIRASINRRGRKTEVDLITRPVLWYAVKPDQQVMLVIVRDVTGIQHDDFFFTTDLDADPADVVTEYHSRWAIEDTFRAVKQHLGGQQPQSWKGAGPERAAALSFWIYTAIWCWYIPTHGNAPHWPTRPWYPNKRTPSFPDALAELRTALWRQRINAISGQQQLTPQIVDTLIDTLARAA